MFKVTLKFVVISILSWYLFLKIFYIHTYIHMPMQDIFRYPIIYPFNHFQYLLKYKSDINHVYVHDGCMFVVFPR